MHKYTCKLFENFGYRQAIIKKAITYKFSQDMEDYSIIDILTHKLNDDRELSEDVLYELGLKRVKARQYFYIIKALINTCYSNEHLFEIIAEYATGKNDPVGDPGKSYLYNEKIVDTWFTYVNNKTDVQIHCVNVSTTKNIDNLLKTLPTLTTNQSLFFHATSWKSYKSISSQGINHQYGRKCLDFGKLPSFYLTPDINAAINWCEKSCESWYKECCILVYALNDYTRANEKHKIFNSITKEWQDQVKESRLCKYSDDKQLLDTYDIIYGPMCANVYKVIYENKAPMPHSRIKYQLASKSEKSDEYITNCFKGVLILRVPTSP